MAWIEIKLNDEASNRYGIRFWVSHDGKYARKDDGNGHVAEYSLNPRVGCFISSFFNVPLEDETET